MAAPKIKKKKSKKRVDPEGIGFIKATFNNTIVTLTDKFGNAIYNRAGQSLLSSFPGGKIGAGILAMLFQTIF